MEFWHGKLTWLPPEAGLDLDGQSHDLLAILHFASRMQEAVLSETLGETEGPPAPFQSVFTIQDELTARHRVIECGYEAVAQLLLKGGADIHEKCKAKVEINLLDATPTALHLAAFTGHYAMVQLLLDNLIVATGGGAPSSIHDIRLGDIVVGVSQDGTGGVLQYNSGKTVYNQSFQTVGYPNKLPSILRTAVNGLKAQYIRN
jgi:ankyrin repeat protein